MNVQISLYSSTVLIHRMTRIKKFYPSVVKILENIKEKYAEQDFLDLTKAIEDGIIPATDIEKFYYEHNENIDALFKVFEKCLRENPLIEQGKKLIEQDKDIFECIKTTAGQNPIYCKLLYRLRTYHNNNDSFIEMVFFIEDNGLKQHLLDTYKETDYNTEQVYSLITYAQRAPGSFDY